MICINRNEIETFGGLQTQMVDATMILDYLYDEIEAEYGKRAPSKFLLRMVLQVIRKKRKERHYDKHHN